VRLRVDGLSPRQVPDSLDLAAYRVIQEILTNALRHGQGVVDLAVAQTGTELRITATNTTAGPISANAGTGRGLDGIRHRVELFNGEVTAGPDPVEPTTWRVSLTLPIEESP
jgi:signal transduction histidine kinase